MACDRTFLSLWSYTNVYRKPEKELCDLLVVVGNDVIIFSDKNCRFPDSESLDIDWKRWFRRAIMDSAAQLWGAERWIKSYPDEVFIDKKCNIKLPIHLTIDDNTNFHLVLVAHGASDRCRQVFGGRGSLRINSELKGFANHTIPFVIGDLDRGKTFVHVLDDISLDVVLQNRDTIIDFTTYLEKRENLLRSEINVASAGEEDLLAEYMKKLNKDGDHDFVLPDDSLKFTHLVFEEGGWDDFQINPQRIAQIEANRISYLWDNLIEEFSKHALAGTQYFVTKGGFSDSEKTIRFLAKETRFERRVLAAALHEIITNTDERKRMLRVIPMKHDNIYYAFLLFPNRDALSTQFQTAIPYDQYRQMRGDYLESVCLVTRLMNPDAKHVVGISMESGIDTLNRSEDLMYFDCSSWDQKLEEEAKMLQMNYRILVSPTKVDRGTQREYPDV